MRQTYQEAITQVFQDEGGYSNDTGDPGGPTNWGITIHDARTYWKPDATAEDVKNMPKSVAEDIYVKHYATPLHYNDLPAGVDYAVLDYGINSGISRSAKVLQEVLKVNADGVIGPITIGEANKANAKDVINAIYMERISFLRGLPTWNRFGRGWLSRCNTGNGLALKLSQEYGKPVNTVPVSVTHGPTGTAVAAGGGAAIAVAHGIPLAHVLIVLGIVALGLFIGIEIYRRKQNVLAQN